MKTFLNLYIYVVMGLLCSWMSKAENEPSWSCDPYTYQYDMSLYMTLQKEGQPLEGDFLIAAFCGEECRGVAEIQTVEEISFYYMRVRSNQESGESICFKVYDRTEKKEVNVLGSLSFSNMQQVGYPSQPWVLTVSTVPDIPSPDDPDTPEDPNNPDNPDDPNDPNNPTAIEDVETLVIKVYPTRVTDYVHVGVLPAKSRLILFTLSGMQVKQVLSCEGDIDLYMGDQPAGVYVLYILAGEEQKQTVKLIKK